MTIARLGKSWPMGVSFCNLSSFGFVGRCIDFVVITIDVPGFALTHVDEFIDELLTRDYSCDIALPRIKKRFVFCFCFLFYFSFVELFGLIIFWGLCVCVIRWNLESIGALEPRKSALEDDYEEEEEKEENEQLDDGLEDEPHEKV